MSRSMEFEVARTSVRTKSFIVIAPNNTSNEEMAEIVLDCALNYDFGKCSENGVEYEIISESALIPTR